MTVVDGSHDVCIRVGSQLIEKILLNISADCLNRVIGNISVCHQEIVLLRSINGVSEQREHCTLRVFLSI